MTMLKIAMTIVGSLLLIGAMRGTDSTAAASLDRRVQDLLRQMTLEEKVGQMTQVTIDVVSKGVDGRLEPHELDSAKLDRAILQYHVGSILNVGPAGYSVDHWNEVITTIQDVATRRTRLKIPILYGIDAVHGANYTLGATLFPQPTALAATWNRELASRTGEITAVETRASGIPWNFYPVMDIGRQPLWPRLWETFGEDVCLTSSMGGAYIKGLQGADFGARDKVAACLKHYAGYGFPMTGKDRTAAWISERMLREYFLPPFEAGIRAGAPTVMVNSAEVDGIPGHANHHLITEVLKGELKFDGFVVSDWQDVQRLHTRDRVASSPKEAVRMAIMAGVDMSMVPLDFTFFDLLLECAKDGSVAASRIDDAVGRILKVKIRMGLFERPYPDPSLKSRFAEGSSARQNLLTAQEAITLLKNQNGVLPLARTARVLVTGPTANSLSALNSGWTITWQGNEEARYPKDKLTLLRALQSKIGAERVTYVPGTTFDKPVDIVAAVDAARRADAIVACLGERAYCETPGNIDDLTLDDVQLILANAMIKTGKPVIIVLIEGRPRIIRPVVDGAAAILMAYLPGMEGGNAIADVLVGDANPSGKLPITYPKYPNALQTYDAKPADLYDGNTYAPQFPFGYGLSYTTFSYSDMTIDRTAMGLRDTVHIAITVKNTGARPGKEVVQLYVRDDYGSVSRPDRQLKGFAKVSLEPGEGTKVSFALTSSDLSFVGIPHARIVEPGTFTAMIDRFAVPFTLLNKASVPMTDAGGKR
ncbi:MAG: glycoside hydrolase family 3 N-terminal domain-containing protein [Bacteroidota bacterium]